MSLFPRNISNDRYNSTSFQRLFRLLDDFDTYEHKDHHRGGDIMKSFTPKFDVKEAGEVYELHGELPGIDQSNVEIEFTDSQTLQVRGRTERSYNSGSPPAGLVESFKSAGAIEGDNSKAHKATVEDEDSVSVQAPDTTNGKNEVAKKGEKPAEPKEKYWVSERSVGEFSRSFTFPVRVDAEHVQASMKNGILKIVVPKAKKEQARKIEISS